MGADEFLQKTRPPMVNEWKATIATGRLMLASDVARLLLTAVQGRARRLPSHCQQSRAPEMLGICSGKLFAHWPPPLFCVRVCARALHRQRNVCTRSTNNSRLKGRFLPNYSYYRNVSFHFRSYIHNLTPYTHTHSTAEWFSRTEHKLLFGFFTRAIA